jgi:hypothetical protein
MDDLPLFKWPGRHPRNFHAPTLKARPKTRSRTAPMNVHRATQHNEQTPPAGKLNGIWNWGSSALRGTNTMTKSDAKIKRRGHCPFATGAYCGRHIRNVAT